MLKMLIADDEPVIIRGLQMLIDWAQLGIEICATCENGADALREIFAQSPDLALLDISMPGKTGIEILKALHTAQSRTKVIFISGFQDFSYAHDALSYGAVDYLLKPVKNDDLLRAVEKCLPVQPEHSAPAPASDTGSYSDAFSRVAEMEPASYILTAVQPLGLTARNAMERQLIEFSIFGQLDTLCRQTGQGTAFQKKGQCYLLLVNMTQAQATGWLHDAQALLEQRTKCKVGFVCSPATAEMSAVPTFTAPAAMPAAGSILPTAYRIPCLRWMHRRLARPLPTPPLCIRCRRPWLPALSRPTGKFSTVRWKTCWPLFRPSPMAAPMRLSTTCLSAGAWCRRGWNAPACSARAAATTCWMPHERPPITRRWKYCSKNRWRSCTARWPGRSRKMNIRTFKR